MDPPVEPEVRDSSFMDVDKALESLSSHRCWLLCLFLMCSSPGVFNAWHLMLSNFYAFIPQHWCDIPELSNANWTTKQIQEVSMPKPMNEDNTSCTMISWNYTHLIGLGYEEALKYINSTPLPPEIPCKSFTFDDKEPYASVVSQWSLVCDDKIHKSNVQSTLAFGKLIGGFLCGFIADRFGRKTSYVLSCAIYIIFGHIAAFSPTFWFFLVARFMIGIAASGVYETGFTILAELVSKQCRTILGCAFNCSYSVGYTTLAVGTLAFSSWRILQLAFSIPTLLLIINSWYIPESPRWLVTQGRLDKAWKIINDIDKSLVPADTPRDVNQKNVGGHQTITSDQSSSPKYCVLFSSCELIKRVLLCFTAWFVASLTYYVLALNSENFGIEQHIYLFVSGAVEIPGYLFSVFMLLHLGRKSTIAILFFVTSLILFAIPGIPQDYTNLILAVAMLGRFTDIGAFGTVVVITSELFPTTTRNFVIGSSLAISQFGSMFAPYIVDFMSVFGWYVPSTLCGCAALFCSALMLLLPETRGRPLPQTVEDLEDSRDRVSLYNCCKFS